MKKNKIKFWTLTLSILLLAGLSLFFYNKVSAQNQVSTLDVKTTGYSVLSPSNFVFGGYFSGNLEKKPLTTYFEYKKNDFNLDNSTDRKETIKIERKIDVKEENEFYTSPELELFSTYYFRAVGYFNDNPDQKFYGRVLKLVTGPTFISKIPFTMDGYLAKPFEPTFIIANAFMIKTTDTTANIKTIISNLDARNLKLKIEYGVDGYDYQSDFMEINSSSTASVTLENLEPETEYYFRLFDPEGNLYQSNDGKFTTQEASTNAGGSDGQIPIQAPSPMPVTPTTVDNSTKTASQYEGSLVPCGIEKNADGTVKEPCGFNDFIQLINNVINFIFLNLALPLAAVMFAYAGFELVSSGGETEKRNKAKKILLNTVIGLVIAAAAFLIVNTILSIAGARTDLGINWFGIFGK